MSYAVGSLVRARDREWVVLPDSQPDLLMLRPLGGSDDEVTGVYLPLEPVAPARFEPPTLDRLGDARTCRLLRDAVRLGFRHSAGPFRSFARIAIEPRPYQLVPLILALRQQPVRLLIADDVGVGKTIEAALIARELLDRGEVQRLCVLCPPHLCEQWQLELSSKFNLAAEVVLPGTVSRLERDLAPGQSLFTAYPHLIVSLDFIKADRRRDDFLRACPDLVIVDEAHTCAASDADKGGRHQRHQLLKGLAKDPARHLLLVTATPHSGKEDAFRSLLTLLKPEFAGLPADLSGKDNEAHRKHLAQHLCQRRRGDIKSYLHSDTPFPERLATEEAYRLTPEYRAFFDRVLALARDSVNLPDTASRRQVRIRWWSALALLRALASSPAAAAATLRNRAAAAGADTAEAADDIGRQLIMDLTDSESGEGLALDLTPGADPTSPTDPAAPSDPDPQEARLRQTLKALEREALALHGKPDGKLTHVEKLLRELLYHEHRVIVFCRFIDTAEYLAKELRARLPKDVEIAAVTGDLPPEGREQRVLELAARPRRVLIATDCLSEGINLQEHFDALIHYDLSWNPTRHEQREGRIDRYGQRRAEVRVTTFYGGDNPIDGLVLDVLLRKQRQIRSSLGVSVPIPVNSEQLIEALLEGLLLRGKRQTAADQLSLFGGASDDPASQRQRLASAWDAAEERERRSRTLFAQHSVKVEEVEQELRAVRGAIGSGVELSAFLRDALLSLGARVQTLPPTQPGLSAAAAPLRLDLSEAPRALRESMNLSLEGAPRTGPDAHDGLHLQVALCAPVPEGAILLSRTHPLVAGLAGYVMDTALDPNAAPATRVAAQRAGVIVTRAVTRRTTALLLRLRYHLLTRGPDWEKTLLCEDCVLCAFTGPPDGVGTAWLSDAEAEALLQATPDRNTDEGVARVAIGKVLDGLPRLQDALSARAAQRGEEILQSHRRVRLAPRLRHSIEPVLPVDVLGIYVYQPA